MSHYIFETDLEVILKELRMCLSLYYAKKFCKVIKIRSWNEVDFLWNISNIKMDFSLVLLNSSLGLENHAELFFILYLVVDCQNNNQAHSRPKDVAMLGRRLWYTGKMPAQGFQRRLGKVFLRFLPIKERTSEQYCGNMWEIRLCLQMASLSDKTPLQRKVLKIFLLVAKGLM